LTTVDAADNGLRVGSTVGVADVGPEVGTTVGVVALQSVLQMMDYKLALQ